MAGSMRGEAASLPRQPRGELLGLSTQLSSRRRIEQDAIRLACNKTSRERIG
jgi:hypothetical protein